MAGVKRPPIVDPRDKRQNAETCRVATATKVGDNDRGEKLFMKKHRRSSDHLYCSCLDDRAVKRSRWWCSTCLLVSIHIDQIGLNDCSE